ncbi:hypothetical protein KQI84_07530 [bacterium]|nr:hypothetical protein [bacterium]
MARPIAISKAVLIEAFSGFTVYNVRFFLDAEDGAIIQVPHDVVEYCLGRGEGTDLQLSDSHDLPLAQRIADEIQWLAQGFDDEGMIFEQDDQRYFPITPLGGRDEQEIRDEVEKWLDDNGLETVD